MTVNGDADIDNTFFEAGASYRLSASTPVAVIGGLRTFTLSSQVEFSTSNISVTPIDANRTAVSVFAGVTYRPALSAKVSLISRVDIGGGSGMSWSGMLGFEIRPKPWLGLAVVGQVNLANLSSSVSSPKSMPTAMRRACHGVPRRAEHSAACH